MSLLGGSLYPKIDQRAFPFQDNLGVPITIKEQRLENVAPSATGQVTSVALGTAGGTTALSQTIIFEVKGTSDETMYDLHNSYFQAQMALPNLSALNCGMAQFASNNMILDAKVYFGTTLVSESHTGDLYPWQSFMKDILTKERPCALSAPATAIAGAALDLTEDAIEEGNYVSYPLTTLAPGAANTSALAFTNLYISGNTVYIRFKVKDGIFLTQKYFPASMDLKIQLTMKLLNWFQERASITDLEGANPAIALNNINFLLNRVILADEAKQALNQALLSKPYTYVLPYTSCVIQGLAPGQTKYNIASIFQGELKPDLLLVAFQDPAKATKAYPYVACGTVDTVAPTVTSLYVKQGGHQYPEVDCFPLATDLRTYQCYVDQCLQDSDNVYLDYLHWLNHYTVYAISLRDDKEKVYGLAPSTEPANLSMSVTFSSALAALTNAVIFGIRHVGLTISKTGVIDKQGWPN